jgi:hypothetical protein
MIHKNISQRHFSRHEWKRGPKLAVLVEPSMGISPLAAFDMAEKGRFVIASAKKALSSVLAQYEKPKKTSEGYYSVETMEEILTGTAFCYTEPNIPFLKSKNYSRQDGAIIVPGMAYEVAFHVPKEFLYYSGVLVVNHPEFGLDRSGFTIWITPHEGKAKLLNFPLRSSPQVLSDVVLEPGALWSEKDEDDFATSKLIQKACFFRKDPEFGIPVRPEIEQTAAQRKKGDTPAGVLFLDRNAGAGAGLVACGLTGQYMAMGRLGDSGLWVLREAPEGTPELKKPRVRKQVSSKVDFSGRSAQERSSKRLDLPAGYEYEEGCAPTKAGATAAIEAKERSNAGLDIPRDKEEK